PILYGAWHPMSLAPRAPGERALQEVVVGGPLCESGDIFTQDEGGFVRTPRRPEARVGEWVVIECAGASGFVMSSNYNGRPQPAEVLVADGKASLARARQSLDDLVRGERIPPSAG
ncbi:MAG: diaminopimelate decarboxylase, partial [Myxococcota bacterium]|nr:diaminopimelate decarboxylase [Myxococcota bacterium]